MAVIKSLFGKSAEGKEISLYTLSNDQGMKAEITDLGATLVRVLVPDATGKADDLVLGFDNGESYYGNDSFFGTVIGPCANRTGGAEYTLDGVTYQLDKNDGANNLHTHKQLGFHKRLWDAEMGENSVTFSLEDEDGHLGFPGNKKVSVTYSLSEENELTLHYHASSDKKTIINLTNHSYFNLDGHGAGSIEEHELWLRASHFTPVAAGSIPTGEIRAVAGTKFDCTCCKIFVNCTTTGTQRYLLKQLQTLCGALKIWKEIETDHTLSEWKLKIVGHGKMESWYKSLVIHYGLQRVFFEGTKNPEPYYNEASIFMMTSSFEGWGLTLTEAQQYGCVPLAFHSFASLTDIITDKVNGFAIPNDDISLYIKQISY